jgi:hypothetical protein
MNAKRAANYASTSYHHLPVNQLFHSHSIIFVIGKTALLEPQAFLGASDKPHPGFTSLDFASRTV